jgi:DNA-binding IclR family transcriptional regulator
MSINGDAPATPSAGRFGHEQGLSSVDNALLLLDELQHRGSLRVSDAAKTLGVAASTAHRLLSCLKQRGYVDQDHRRTYHLGSRLTTGLGPAASATGLLRVARPHLETLASQVTETFHFGVLEGNSVRMLDGYEPSHGDSPVGLRIGWLLPAHLTAVGQVLLADLPDETLNALYPIGLPTGRSREQLDLRELRRRLILVRRKGWASNEEEAERGVVAIAVPVRDGSGMVVASIGAAGPACRQSSKSRITNDLAAHEATGAAAMPA